VCQIHLFDEPEAHEGLIYEKGNEYVVAMLTESGWSRERVGEAVEELARMSGKNRSIPHW